MPYSSARSWRTPANRETTATEFIRADGSREALGRCTKQTALNPDGDVDTVVVRYKAELACGCYWPDAEVGGVCTECAGERVNPNVCKAHYVVCQCGTPCCWKHSHPTDDGTTRICTRCHIRTRNKACKAAVVGALGRIARRLFFTKPEDPPSVG